jgi:hypothetical protein
VFLGTGKEDPEKFLR